MMKLEKVEEINEYFVMDKCLNGKWMSLYLMYKCNKCLIIIAKRQGICKYG